MPFGDGIIITLEEIGICITIVISFISLVISVGNSWRNKPKLKIEITDKECDCFFGITMQKNVQSRISGARINIINNSPVAITLSNIYLEIDGENYNIIDKNNPYWEVVEFYFINDEDELTTDGTAIEYFEGGLDFPSKINAYDTLSAYVLFHNFPAKYKEKCSGKIVMCTAIGKIKKKVNFVKYDSAYAEKMFSKEYWQYRESLEDESV